jgi:hypothetical protein
LKELCVECYGLFHRSTLPSGLDLQGLPALKRVCLDGTLLLEDEFEESHGFAAELATWPVEPIDGQWSICVGCGSRGFPFWRALMPLQSALWPKKVRKLSMFFTQQVLEAVSITGSIFSGAEELSFAVGCSHVDLMAVVRMMPCVKEVSCNWSCLAGGNGAVSLEGIVAACAAAQEARRPLLLHMEDLSGEVQVDASGRGGGAHSQINVRQAAERLQALWAQRLQTLPGPCTVQLN